MALGKKLISSYSLVFYVLLLVHCMFPIVAVSKKDGGVRLGVDYRASNKITQPDPYLMPRIDDIIDHLLRLNFFLMWT